ncbi:zinc-binding dehydrogenase [Eubacteriales bacterium OttesenSCG-928-N14]|nr:zinc-binding dehydrogenase [Eubacteriales bacterium OttesenSCG-928-N14]
MAMMRAVAVTDIGKVELIEVEKPQIGPGEVLVRNRAASLCTVEQRAFKGIIDMPKPFVGGHEVAGEIVELGEGLLGDWKVGEKVITRCFPTCHVCYYCRLGYENQCINGAKLRGKHKVNSGLGEFMAVPEFQLFKCAEDVPYEQAAITEPISCVLHSIDKGRIDFGDDVVVIGAGIMGLLHTQLSKLRGANVIVSEVSAERRALAEKMGANVTFDPTEKDPVEFVKSLTDGRGADVIFNTTAVSAVWDQAIGMVGKLGRIVAYSSQHPDNPVGVKMGNLHSREYEIIGTVSPAINDFRRAAKLHAMKALQLEELISAVIPYTDGQKAFETAVAGAYRVVIEMPKE